MTVRACRSRKLRTDDDDDDDDAIASPPVQEFRRTTSSTTNNDDDDDGSRRRSTGRIVAVLASAWALAWGVVVARGGRVAPPAASAVENDDASAALRTSAGLSVVSADGVHVSLGSDPTRTIVRFAVGGGDRRRPRRVGRPVVTYAKSAVLARDSGAARRKSPANNNNDDDDDAHDAGTSYAASDMCGPPADRDDVDPGALRSVTLDGLEPGRVAYTYKVGITTGQGIVWSHETEFRTLPEDYPVKFVVYGNQGTSERARRMMKHLSQTLTSENARKKPEVKDSVENEHFYPDVVHHVGDLSCAAGKSALWDEWSSMVQPVASKVPLMVALGARDYDHDDHDDHEKRTKHHKRRRPSFRPAWGNFGRNESGGECGVPFAARFPRPGGKDGKDGKDDDDVFWYSYDVGPAHTIVLSSEHDLSEGSAQHEWLKRDLDGRDDNADWTIVEIHRPLYDPVSSRWDETAAGLGLQNEFEPLLRRADLVLSARLDGVYSRTCAGLYQGRCSNGGPTHATVGTAGRRDDDVDANDAPTLVPRRWTAHCSRSVLGYGRVTIRNETALLWEFVAEDGDGTDEWRVADHVWITK